MDKLIAKEPSYYRLSLHAGNIIYFSHAKDVKEEEYIDFDIKDIIAKIDELVEVYNNLVATIQNIVNANHAIKEDAITALQLQIDDLKANKTNIKPQDIKLD